MSYFKLSVQVWPPAGELLFIYVQHTSDEQTVIQVSLDVTEASGSGVIATIAIISMAVGLGVLTAIDFAALKKSFKLFVRNARTIIRSDAERHHLPGN